METSTNKIQNTVLRQNLHHLQKEKILKNVFSLYVQYMCVTVCCLCIIFDTKLIVFTVFK